MAFSTKQILGPNTVITFNGTDISQYCTSITLEDTADEVEVTGFSQTFKEYRKGLRDAVLTATITMGTVTDALIGATYYNDTQATVKVNPDNVSGTAVVYTLISKAYGWSPVGGGAPGALNSNDITFRNDGTAGLTRSTV